MGVDVYTTELSLLLFQSSNPPTSSTMDTLFLAFNCYSSLTDGVTKSIKSTLDIITYS